MRRLNLKNKLREIFILFVFSLYIIPVQGQDSYILYGFRDVQQGNYLNPAFTSKAKIVIGFPVLSNLSVKYFNSAGTFKDILRTPNSNDSLPFDLSEVINQGHPVDQINVSLNQDLLYAGFRVRQSFLSFGVKQRILIRTFLPNSFFKQVWRGNAPYVGQTLDLSSIVINEDHFIDYHLGASIPVSKRLTVGLRVHMLQGLSNIHTVNNLFLVTSLDTTLYAYNIGVSTDFKVNTSGIPDSTGFDPRTYFKNFKNFGLAFDLGIVVKATDQLEFSASLLDVGSISFKENTKTYQSKEKIVYFNSDQLELSNISDTLEDLLHVNVFSQNYRVKLPVRVMLGGEYYSKDQRNRTSVLFSGRFYPHYFCSRNNEE